MLIAIRLMAIRLAPMMMSESRKPEPAVQSDKITVAAAVPPITKKTIPSPPKNVSGL